MFIPTRVLHRASPSHTPSADIGDAVAEDAGVVAYGRASGGVGVCIRGRGIIYHVSTAQ